MHNYYKILLHPVIYESIISRWEMERNITFVMLLKLSKEEKLRIVN